jgi:Leucine-rich repeat (LRR) protein
MQQNELTAIPTAIGRLTNLQKLDLSFNSLQILPISVFQLPKLQELNADINDISALPSLVGMKALAHQLVTLSLGGNPLEEIPLSFGYLKSLQKFTHSCFSSGGEVVTDGGFRHTTFHIQWSPHFHRHSSDTVKECIKFLLLTSLAPKGCRSSFEKLPKDILLAIFAHFSVERRVKFYVEKC